MSSKTLIQLPNDASTSKYPKTFPQPLNLLCFYEEGDRLVDLALASFGNNRPDINSKITKLVRRINESNKEMDIIVNAGDFPADAEYSQYYERFFDRLIKPAKVIGTYSKVYPEKITKYDNLTILDDELIYPNFQDFKPGMYPLVDGKTKFSLRASTGCARNCLMCPVKKCFEGYDYLDVDETMATLEWAYEKGAKYFTFIDDNLSMSPKFIELLEKIKRAEFKAVKFHCQEGFDLGSFSPEIAKYLKILNFDDIKIAFENIKPTFIQHINKPHITPDRINEVLEIIKQHELDVKAFFLMGLDESEQDVLDNIKFFADNNMTVRTNIVRNYNNDFVSKFKKKVTHRRFKELKALSYASSFFTDMGVNIFGGQKELEKLWTVEDIGDEIHIKGKTKYGFQTSRFETGLKYIFNYPIEANTGEIVVLSKVSDREEGFGLIDKSIDEDATGVNIESLKKSRELRARFLQKFGTMPQSILIADRIEMKKRTDIITDEMGGGAYGYQRKKGQKFRKDETTRGLESTGFVVQGRTKTDVLSAFPQNIGRVVIELYCPERGLIFDPFAGHNSRMELVYNTGRSYVGVDLSAKFMEANIQIKEMLLSKKESGFFSYDKKQTIDLIEGSSAKVDLPDNYADFTLTSPPYYNLEYYGPEEQQLGSAPSYEDFIINLYDHVAENYRILKPETYCCWFINDFRRNKTFYPYHIDLYSLFIDAGFTPFNIYIVDLGWPVNGAFVQDILKHKILPKRHEYCLVFRKD